MKKSTYPRNNGNDKKFHLQVTFVIKSFGDGLILSFLIQFFRENSLTVNFSQVFSPLKISRKTPYRTIKPYGSPEALRSIAKAQRSTKKQDFENK